jgi:glycosyltransferase
VIRVLHVVQRMEAGGTQALLMNLYKNIDRKKVQFDFLVEYNDKQFYDDEIIKLGGKIYYTNIRKDFNIISFKRKVKKILKENKYEIVHVHASNVGNIVFKIAKKIGINVRIAHAHNNSSVKDIKYIPRMILRKLYVNKATDYFACSKDAGEFFFKEKNFIILNNAIDTEKFIFNEESRNIIRKKLHIENDFVVGNIGRLHMQKNHKFLIDIFIKIKEQKENAKLVIIGDGPLEDEIKNYIKNNNIINDVILLKNRKDIPELLWAMDIFILPSLFEGLGIVTIESQAAGTPCLVSNNVPDLTNITPIIKYEDLNKSNDIWAIDAIELSKNDFSHKNMSSLVKENNFDIKNVAQFLQEYYLNKVKSEGE